MKRFWLRPPWWIYLGLTLGSWLFLQTWAKAWEAHLSFPELHTPSEALPALGRLATAASLQLAQYTIPGLLFLLSLASAWHKRRHIRRMSPGRIDQQFDTMTWHDFELFVGDLFRAQGYRVEVLGGDGPDGGVDLILTKDGETAYVQCKQWKTVKVGVDVVRELYGVMAADDIPYGCVVTTGIFTEASHAFAQGLPLELIDRERLRMLVQSTYAQGTWPKKRSKATLSKRPANTQRGAIGSPGAPNVRKRQARS